MSENMMNYLNKDFTERVNGLLTTKEQDIHVKPNIVKAKPKIQRVPNLLRERMDSYSDYYEPLWMSIGPIHHGYSKFESADTYKLLLAAKFIRKGGCKSLEEFCGKINTEAMNKIVEECFSEEIIDENKNGDESLSSILFFDGCAILQFIHSSRHRDYEEFKELIIKEELTAYTLHDLFLLENQIPYRVLKLLIETRSIQEQNHLKESIRLFIIGRIMAPEKYQRKLQESWKNPFDPEPAHLLDLLLSALLHCKDRKQKSSGTDVVYQLENVEPIMPARKIPRWRARKPKDKHSFRSVKDLRAAGIILRRSNTSAFGDIKFSSLGFSGTLKLPPLLVDHSTASKFMNLIAYEMCPDNTETEYEVTSYVCFLDTLIDYAADVKELRSARILYHRMGSDKEVAQLFNTIAKDLLPNPAIYKRVKDDIENHSMKKHMAWMAQVFNDHFSSPWTIVAFFAAALAIAMTGIQTWFTVYPPDSPCDNFCKHLNKL